MNFQSQRVWAGMLLLGGLAGCGSETAPPPVATAVAFNAAGAPTVEFNAPDMMCPEGCGAKVKEILSAQPGAKDVVIDFDAKTATVAVDSAKFDTAAALAALVDHGFEHSSLKTDNPPSAAAATSAEEPAG